MRVSHADLFGEDFYQDSQVIRISKSSLGLQAREYSPEGLFLALLLRALQPYQGVITGNGLVITGNGSPVTYKNTALYERLTLFYWQRSLFVNRQGISIHRRSYVVEYFSSTNLDNPTVSVRDLEA